MRVRTTLRRAVVLGTMVMAALILGVEPQSFAGPARPAATGSAAPGAVGVLTDLVISRLLLGDQVAAAKFGTGLPITDAVREQAELAIIRREAAALGLDEQAAVAFFTDQITASKIVQQGLIRRWTASPESAPAVRPDLGTVRAELDRLTNRLLHQLRAVELDGGPDRVAGPISNGLDPLHRDALRVALQRVRIIGR